MLKIIYYGKYQKFEVRKKCIVRGKEKGQQINIEEENRKKGEMYRNIFG